MKKKKLSKLIKKHKLIDQSAFIEDLLRQDHELKYMNGIVNLNWYKAKISTGMFKGTEVQYSRILKKLQVEMDNAKDDTTRERLLEDISAIEDSYQGERKVKQWFAIPYWMGKDFKDKGEVVLYVSGACWWGY